MKNKEGEYFGENAYDTIVSSNCDVYYYEDGQKKTLLKFRKNVIPEKFCKLGLECLKEAAKKTHDNRGAAAGILSEDKLPSYAKMGQLIGKSKFNTHQMESLKIILKEWKKKYPKAKILGHRDSTKTKKTCPNFDVTSWCQKNLI